MFLSVPALLKTNKPELWDFSLIADTPKQGQIEVGTHLQEEGIGGFKSGLMVQWDREEDRFTKLHFEICRDDFTKVIQSLNSLQIIQQV